MKKILAAVLSLSFVWAQGSKETSNDSFYFEDKKIFATAQTKFSLVSNDELSKVSFTEYKIDSQPFRKYFEPISIVEEGEHRLLYRSYDKAGNKESDTLYQVIIDNSPPKIQRFLDKRLFQSYSVLYGPPGFTISLIAKDEYSGVKSLDFAINDGEAKSYNQAIILNEGGLQKVSYQAIDKLGNRSSKNTIYIHVDNQPPRLTIKPKVDFQLLDKKSYTFKNNVLSIEAEDVESGIKQIVYRFGKQKTFTTYTQPIILNESGEFKFEAKAVDNVGNTTPIKVVEFIVDALPPQSKIQMIKGTN